MDPDTGLIYFKYDFGYEFGIILPGESKSGEIPVPKKTVIEPPKRSVDIEMPVYHETSGAPTPQFKPKKFTNKWDPTSESEMSEYEGEPKRKSGFSQGSRWGDPSSCSPYSMSPSLPSTSPAFNHTFAGTSSVLRGSFWGFALSFLVLCVCGFMDNNSNINNAIKYNKYIHQGFLFVSFLDISL